MALDALGSAGWHRKSAGRGACHRALLAVVDRVMMVGQHPRATLAVLARMALADVPTVV